MTETLTIPDRQRVVSIQMLACRLRPKKMEVRRGPILQMAEFELENISATPVEITYRMTVLQHLNLVIANADGDIVSEGHFGDRFAPTLERQVLRLEPAAKFTADVYLLATVRHTPLPSGLYSVQAIYECDEWRTVSQAVEITL